CQLWRTCTAAGAAPMLLSGRVMRRRVTIDRLSGGSLVVRSCAVLVIMAALGGVAAAQVIPPVNDPYGPAPGYGQPPPGYAPPPPVYTPYGPPPGQYAPPPPQPYMPATVAVDNRPRHKGFT